MKKSEQWAEAGLESSIVKLKHDSQIPTSQSNHGQIISALPFHANMGPAEAEKANAKLCRHPPQSQSDHRETRLDNIV